MRTETRRERYQAKQSNAIRMPVALACINLGCDENVGFLARTVACFGGSCLHVVGRVPPHKELMKYSGSTSCMIKIVQHQSPLDFLKYCREKAISIISAELTDASVDLDEMAVDFASQSCIVVGHETAGVPVEILNASTQVVKIPMPGFGYSLNVSQAGNIFLFNVYQRFKNPENLPFS